VMRRRGGEEEGRRMVAGTGAADRPA